MNGSEETDMVRLKIAVVLTLVAVPHVAMGNFFGWLQRTQLAKAV
jgi:hypothetical protein